MVPFLSGWGHWVVGIWGGGVSRAPKPKNRVDVQYFFFGASCSCGSKSKARPGHVPHLEILTASIARLQSYIYPNLEILIASIACLQSYIYTPAHQAAALRSLDDPCWDLAGPASNIVYSVFCLGTLAL